MSYEEVFGLFETAAENNVPCHLHARYKGNIFPGTMSLAVMEVVAVAAATGAQAQVAHMISSTVGSAPLSIKLIEGAVQRGVDVAFDFHDWTRNQTGLKSALYDEGWQERFGGQVTDEFLDPAASLPVSPELQTTASEIRDSQRSRRYRRTSSCVPTRRRDRSSL